MRLLVIMLRRNELQSQQLEISPHELPIMAYVHGEEACNVVGMVDVPDREMPTVQAEMERLATKYGRDKANESIESRVSAVFGNGRRGLQQLAEAMAYGQRENAIANDFKLGIGEPSHEAPDLDLAPSQKTRPQPAAHDDEAESRRMVARGGASAAPRSMRPGVSDAKRKGTVKSKRDKAVSKGLGMPATSVVRGAAQS